jgi:hypothetical protein
MSTDIQSHVELKISGEWKAIKGENFFYDKLPGEKKQVFVNWVFELNSYPLYAILADVRNDYGIEPICEPRGLLGDISIKVQKYIDYHDGDEYSHSHSWYSFKELLAYDWDSKSLISEYYDNEEVLYSEIAKQVLKNIRTCIKENKIENLENARVVFWFYD